MPTFTQGHPAPIHSQNTACLTQHSLGEKPGDSLAATDAIFRSASATDSPVLYTPDLIENLLGADGKDLGWGARRPKFELHSAFTSNITLTIYNLSEP